MVKKFIFAMVLLLLCSSCVSRTTLKEPGLKESKVGNSETKLVWFWNKDF